MKFSWIISIISLFLISTITARGIELNEETVQTCEPNKWVATNINITWNDHIKTFTAYIFYNGESNNTVYEIYFTYNCTNIQCYGPNRTVNQIDCAKENSLSESDMKVCALAEEIGKLQNDNNWLDARYGNYERYIRDPYSCVNLENLEINTSFLEWLEDSRNEDAKDEDEDNNDKDEDLTWLK